MKLRCKWCGVYVRADAEPTWGANRWGVPIAQLLCPADSAYWADVLTMANLERIHTELEPSPA